MTAPETKRLVRRLKPVHYVYAMALLVSGSVAFGVVGLVAGLLISAGWGTRFLSRSGGLWSLGKLAIAGGLCLGWLYPALQVPRAARLRTQCMCERCNRGILRFVVGW